ncbi:thioesterase domain-containing protein [Rhodococcoides kyotonense]|uniref:Thioesterase domain-containing protein n=1 Tax=Rhodococcoides kyotonense TaxID=398843 RepID=A0A239KFD3_9NOCA|nr:thioesterase domain-containing protein [Rhodococcus kyotonensis]SNT15854.1 Thioesterase domain-containing protein [Rhodococcus kyotonensis]
MTVVNDYTQLAYNETVTAYATPAIVPIRTTGTQAPVFCIHPIEGLTSCYAELVEHIDEDRPVFGVQAIGERLDSLTALAARYADDILGVHTDGPVHLLGASFGGLLAHAVAIELQGRGVKVDSLVLVDSNPLERRPQDNLLARMGDVIDRSRAEELLAVAAHNEELASRHFPGVFVGNAFVVSGIESDGGPAWHAFVSGAVTKYLVPDASAFGLVGPLVNRFF